MAKEGKTSIKRPAKPFRGAVDGKPFTTENQPTSEEKKNGWQEKRAQRHLTQMIIKKVLDDNNGENLDEIVESIIANAKMGNAKAIDVLINGIEEQITKTETTITDTRPPSKITTPDGLIIEL